MGMMGGAPPAPPVPAAPPVGNFSPPPAKAPERKGLLNSIEGFKKGGLKKTVTVDKSKPMIEPEKGSGGGGYV